MTTETAYGSLGAIAQEAAEAFRPPERIRVSEAAEKYVYLNTPGAYVGPYLNDNVPYMVEPMDTFTDRSYEGCIIVAPAQSAKTALFENWLTYGVACDPMDMIMYHMTQNTARDFSISKLNRAHRNTPALREAMLPGNAGDNVFDKRYRNGMLVSLSWPTVANLSGKSVGRVFLTDYDRMPQDVDKEGSPYDLAKKRTTAFKSAGMTVAESSPGFIIEDPRWERTSLHEAPPCKGILALYNRGDRRRFYWKCPGCGEWFEPSFSLLHWPESGDIVEAAESACMMCPHCKYDIRPDQKYHLNIEAAHFGWIKDGQRRTRHDKLEGTAYRSPIASFWLKGPAASFAPWSTLVGNYLRAEHEYFRTGEQEALKTTTNTDQGEPYKLRGHQNDRTLEELKGAAVDYPEKEVPPGVRFLIATADVQRNKFVAQVFGVAPGANDNFDLYALDRIVIEKSKRRDTDGDPMWIKPHEFVEDWRLLKEKVLDNKYQLNGVDGEMKIRFMLCDSGGKDGVTNNAYDFWRWLRKQGEGDHARFLLCKGEKRPTAPRAEITYPDNRNRKDRKAGARGEIPVLLLNVNLLKDKLDGMVGGEETNGSFLMPSWFPDEVFLEMLAEVRGAKGWENKNRRRNEAWDLATYALGACVHMGIEKINWEAPPNWAAKWKDNALVQINTVDPEVGSAKPFAKAGIDTYDLSQLGSLLG